MNSGAVLLEKEADVPIPPASMSKLMTLEVVFEALESGRLSLEDTFRISERAAAMAGSKMFIRSGEVVSVENLVRGVIVQSGNDAAVALGEAISGTEEAFAALMNQRAAEIGLSNSHFANATGWPDPQHRMSPRDLATLAGWIITRYPQHYPLFAETKFTWADIVQNNRNPLLGTGIGVDGLKTGHTEEAGYGLAASAQRDGRRILLVATGLESAQQRSQEAERLINWAFRAFETKRLFIAGEPVAEAEVWIGAAERVALAPARDLIVTVPAGALEKAEITAHFTEPVKAPVEAGVELGRLEVALPGVSPVSVPLVAAHAVERGGITTRLEAAARSLARRLFGPDEG
jgi:D-alanyl-D-alanine carboxypeptidase (penicillin-binding protein 5/6)